MATIILLRHGRTSANASGVLAGWSPDVHLDELGRTQADAAAAITACCTPERIVASPLVRCQETADALRAASGVAVETDDAVGECRYGAWTGRKLDERSSDEQGGSGVGVVVSHGDVIKSMLSDALGQHLDDFQRIVLAPASMSVIRFVGDRPFVLAMNVTSGGLGEAVGLARSTSAESTVGGATGATQ